MAKILIIFFFSLTFTLFAETSKKTITSEQDVYIYGTAFLIVSIGSLLLVVNIFPKGEAYKKQQQRLELAMKLQSNGGKLTASNSVLDASTNATVMENMPTLLKTQITNVDIPAPTHTSVNVPVTKPSIPAIDVQIPEIKSINYNKVFDSKSIAIENTCKDLLNKLSQIGKTKSVSIYFIHSDKFNCLMEKKSEIFTKYEVGKKADLNEEVIKFLRNKLGAFSSNHADAVLPLIHNKELFGGVKLEFIEANPNLNINPIWTEIKTFAKNFEQVTNYNLSVQDTETSLFTLDHFNNILNYRITMDIPQNLTLIKITSSTDKAKAQKEIIEGFKEILTKNPEAYKLSDDLIGVFLSLEERDKISKSTGAILLRAKKNILSLEFNIGSADYNNSMKFANKWYEEANQALNQSIGLGKNQFKLV
jgi:hypothetical protein